MNPLLLLVNLLKPLLYPLSFLYGGIVWLRNKLYDAGVLSSVSFSIPVICVGNLSTGGTGKTPHIEYLIRLLQYQYRVATMSRGYKRRTRGFYLAEAGTDARQIGDEPMQFFSKFPEISVSVCEDRMTGIPYLLRKAPQTEVVLLDDAFQHRSVKPGLNILITDYHKPFYKDHVLPFGSLREGRKAYHRADIIIVSKCPPSLGKSERQEMIRKINPQARQQVFFSGIGYHQMFDFFNGGIYTPSAGTHMVLVSGIAKPEPMLDHLRTLTQQVHLLRYPDHHYFTENNLDEIKQTYDNWESDDKIIVTTEKDAMRLAIHRDTMAGWQIRIVVLPIAISFLDGASLFDQHILQYIESERKEMI